MLDIDETTEAGKRVDDHSANSRGKSVDRKLPQIAGFPKWFRPGTIIELCRTDAILVLRLVRVANLANLTAAVGRPWTCPPDLLWLAARRYSRADP